MTALEFKTGELTDDEFDVIAPILRGNMAPMITDRDRDISRSVHAHKQHLGARGLIECALVIQRILVGRS